MNTLVLPIAAAALCAAATVHAQKPVAGAGLQIASVGTPNGATACIGCHGANGEGNAAANFPRIAGQPVGYLLRQLRSYADGERANPIMTPIAKGLNQDQMIAVAGYYATLAAPSAKPAQAANAAALKRGRQLADIGDDSISVQSCANCHGPGASGQPPNIPYLASQHQAYLAASLAGWKDGSRKTDPSRQMNTLAQRLSAADIAAVSAYFASLPAPAPAALRVNVPKGSAQRPVAPGGTQTGSTPVSGTGVEQGAPLTGGSQGQGGGGGASGAGPQGNPAGGTR